jgi:hypothetical protein
MFGISGHLRGPDRVGHAFGRKVPADSGTFTNFLGRHRAKCPNCIVQATAFKHCRDSEAGLLVAGMEMPEIAPRSFDALGT